MRMSGVSLQRNARQTFQRMLHEPCTDFIPPKNNFEHRNHSQKKQKKHNDQLLSFLPAVGLEVWKVPFHQTTSWITICGYPPPLLPKCFFQAPIQACDSSLECLYQVAQNSRSIWKYSHGFRFVLVPHGTDCSKGQDMANFEEPAADGKISSLSKSNRQLATELIEVDWDVFFSSVSGTILLSPKRTQQTFEHFSKKQVRTQYVDSVEFMFRCKKTNNSYLPLLLCCTAGWLLHPESRFPNFAVDWSIYHGQSSTNSKKIREKSLQNWKLVSLTELF